MNFGEAIRSVFSNYATFEGRAARSEYWFFFLFCFLVQVAGNILLYRLPLMQEVVLGLFGLVVLIPSIAVAARRLHDIDRSGWWQLIVLIPIIGLIVLIVFYCIRGTEGPNRYGPPVVR
jgi:uncharacterized membrane protein YhaH (DUF805 family)